MLVVSLVMVFVKLSLAPYNSIQKHFEVSPMTPVRPTVQPHYTRKDRKGQTEMRDTTNDTGMTNNTEYQNRGKRFFKSIFLP